MNLPELLEELTAQGVQLWAEGGRLRYRAPEGSLTPDLLALLRQRKEELLPLLDGAPVPSRAGGNGSTRSGNLFPLSYGQQSLWFLHQSSPRSAAYNIASTARIRSQLDVAALRRTFQVLVDRHETLRTTYRMSQGHPVQEVHPQQEVDFTSIDASGWTEDELNQAVREAYRMPFDLERGPVLRVCLFTCGPSDHVLLLAMHHIACDGWSLWMLQDEFRTVYPSQLNGRKTTLPDVEARYTDYVRWQEEMLHGPEGEAQWQHWREQLDGNLPTQDMPSDRPRPRTQGNRGKSYQFRLDEDLTDRLRRLAHDEGATLYMTLLSGLTALIHRYTGLDDVLVGSPAAGRTQPQFAKTVGHFVNPVVVRTRLSDDPSAKDLLGQVRRQVISALGHQDFPFPLLVERLRSQHDPSRTPLFQTSLVMHKPMQFGGAVDLVRGGQSPVTIDWGGLQMEPFEMPQQEGQFDLTWEIVETDGPLLGTLKYNTDLFEKATVARMVRHFENLLRAMAEDPGQPIATLAMLDESEWQQLVVKPHARRVDYSRDTCVHQLIEAQVQRSPDATAIQFDGGRLTYAELDRRANQLAHYLLGLGVGRGDLVALGMEQSPELIVGMLGTLKAGGAYVPMDPAYPVERLEFMLHDSGAKVLLADHALPAKLPQPDVAVVDMQADQPEIDRQPHTAPECTATSEDLVYVIYTSGSTGQPKGVAVRHRNLCHLVAVQHDVFGAASDDRVLQFSSPSFDASVWDIFMPLTTGAVLVVAGRENLLPGLKLVDLLVRQRVTFVTLPPPALAALPSAELPDLRTIVSAGDACRAEAVRRWGKGRRFFNGYGPTENTVAAAVGLCQGGQSPPSIGHPIPNVEIYILDGHMQPVPVGVPGEVYIGGDGLARGYIGRPELTAERFVPHPFSPTPGERLYRSGDRCRWRPDGKIDFLGRIDYQVKVDGFRIEPGEIEAVLSKHPEVGQCVVAAREDTPGDRRLVGYVVPANGLKPTTTQLRGFLREHLPGHLIPSAFLVLDSLPLNPNGKIDRLALPSLKGIRPELDRPYVAPRTETEKLLAGVWAEVLGIDKVGIHDDFFELGGASLKSLRVVARLQESGLTIDHDLLKPEVIFEHTTVAELAELIEANQPAAGPPSATPS